MILGIDASNIRAGGGVTHLVELLAVANPAAHGFTQVIVWGGLRTLEKIGDRSWLRKIHDPMLDRPLPFRVFWQRFRLRRQVVDARCDLLFAPGGSDATRFHPLATMNQNLLPFELRELLRYGFSMMTVKFLLLRFVQRATFRRAAGVIYLSRYAREIVARAVRGNPTREVIIPHGINPKFFIRPRSARRIEECTAERPFRLLYVSIVDVYKHQWQVAQAVGYLFQQGVPITLDLVGPPGFAMGKLRRTLRRMGPAAAAVRYHGPIPYEVLHEMYAQAEMAVFASSCETFGQIVTECMAAGLPVVCSNRSAMPELLGDAGEYFDPESSASIAAVLRRCIESPALRTRLAEAAYARAHSYSWDTCADRTFGFLAGTAGNDKSDRAATSRSTDGAAGAVKQ